MCLGSLSSLTLFVLAMLSFSFLSVNEANIETLEDELEALKGANEARCLLSRRPGTANSWVRQVKEQESKHKTGPLETWKWLNVECAVTIHYTTEMGDEGSASASVFAGSDW